MASSPTNPTLLHPDDMRETLDGVRSIISGYGGLYKLLEVQARVNDHGLQGEIQDIILSNIDLIYKINRLIASIPMVISSE